MPQSYSVVQKSMKEEGCHSLEGSKVLGRTFKEFIHTSKTDQKEYIMQMI